MLSLSQTQLFSAFADEFEKIARQQYKPQAIIVPHASPQYSGHIATEVLKLIPENTYDSILLLGLNHEGGSPGIYSGGGYTPDSQRIAALRSSGAVMVKGDHSIGNLLPLIKSLSDTPIVPFVVTEHSPNVVNLLRSILGRDTLIVASTDLSHYHPLARAGAIDHKTINNIMNERGDLDACGANVVKTLLDLVSIRFELVDYDTSAHLENDEKKVVGYAAMQAGGFSPDLLAAKEGVENYLKTGEMPRARGTKRAAFIGISKNGKLQGSMGQTKPSMPANIAAVEAFNSTLTDDRMEFSPESVKTPGSGFEIKIRLFSDMVPTQLKDVKLGIDGLYVEDGNKSAVFLPEVPTKEQWDLDTYLKELLDKAGISGGSPPLQKFKTESIMIFS